MRLRLIDVFDLSIPRDGDPVGHADLYIIVKKTGHRGRAAFVHTDRITQSPARPVLYARSQPTKDFELSEPGRSWQALSIRRPNWVKLDIVWCPAGWSALGSPAPTPLHIFLARQPARKIVLKPTGRRGDRSCGEELPDGLAKKHMIDVKKGQSRNLQHHRLLQGQQG